MKQYIKGIAKGDVGENHFSFLASTSTIDRQGESIDQKGWELDNYKKNAVLLWAHNYSELPIGIVELIEITELGMQISGRFAKEADNPKAGQVSRLYADGILQTVSVGFIPKEYNGNVITKAELLEVSVVPVPANPEALSLAKAKGLDISLLEKHVKALPPVCNVDDETYDAEACNAMICDPESPDYDQEMCDSMKPKEDADTEELPEEKTKGAIADELTAEESFEAKWENIDSIYDIIGAFMNVYMDEATPVENFNTLLTEMITLLQTVAGGGTIEPTEDDTVVQQSYHKNLNAGREIIAKMFAKEIEKLEEKEGKVLSKKNRSLISGSIDAMKSSIAVLDELLNATNSPSEDGKAVATDLPKQPEVDANIVTISKQTLLELRGQLRVNDKHNELSIAVVNRLLGK